MSKPLNIIVAQRFVDLVTKCENPPVQVLSRHLDELALSYHDTPNGDPDENDERLTSEGRVEHADIGARFPTLGFYGSTDLNEVLGEALVGDAIDDIVDIINDLKEVLWRFERFGPNDARWHFRFLYQVHWGQASSRPCPLSTFLATDRRRAEPRLMSVILNHLSNANCPQFTFARVRQSPTSPLN